MLLEGCVHTSVCVCVCTRVCFQSLPTLQPPQAPLFWGFPRQEYWSGSLFPAPGDLSDPGIEPRPPALQADSLQSKPQGKIVRQTKPQIAYVAVVKLVCCM